MSLQNPLPFSLTEETSTSSRRKFPRLNVRRAATVALGAKKFVVATVNLSFGGAFLETDNRILVGSEIEFALEIDGQSFATQARVVHQNKLGIAILFLAPPSEFVQALCKVIGDRVMHDAQRGADPDEVPGRMVFLLPGDHGYQISFTSSIGCNGVWVMTEKTWSEGTRLWVTLPEHGLFDCQADVLWSDEQSMRLQFVEPSDEFRKAYQRTRNAFQQ